MRKLLELTDLYPTTLFLNYRKVTVTYNFLKTIFFSASKRPRINVEDCPLEESDSDQDDGKRNQQSPNLSQPPASSVPSPSPEPVTSPDPDLDIEDDTQSEAPENLSVKREKQPSPGTPPHQHASNFLPYHQQFTQFSSQIHPPYSAVQRSPVDVLMRVFPGRRRSDVEAILQR